MCMHVNGERGVLVSVRLIVTPTHACFDTHISSHTRGSRTHTCIHPRRMNVHVLVLWCVGLCGAVGCVCGSIRRLARCCVASSGRGGGAWAPTTWHVWVVCCVVCCSADRCGMVCVVCGVVTATGDTHTHSRHMHSHTTHLRWLCPSHRGRPAKCAAAVVRRWCA